jgi:hypothetical protein
MRELFIYYRIEVGSAALALGMVQDFQRDLMARHPGLAARLLRRPDDDQDGSNDQQTWMETYSFPGAGGVTPAQQADIESAATVLAPCLRGARHVEVFVPCA